MPTAWPVPTDERSRLAELRSYEILDTGPEPAWDDLTMLATQICGTPMAMVNFIDAERQWGKSLVGLEGAEVSRADSFCARAITRDTGLLVVPDTLADPAWRENPGVVHEPHVRFYAGAAIVSPRGFPVGSICVADTRPREFGAAEETALRALARQAAAQLELRLRDRSAAHVNARLGHLATHDELTGVANRILLVDRITHALERAERSKRLVAVLAIDIDDFKGINERYGAAAGDLALVHAARRLRAASRPMDTLARVEGDEFIMVCEELFQVEHADGIAARVRNALRTPVPLSDAKVDLGASVGVVVGRYGDTVEDLLERADAALNAVKRGEGAGRA